MPQLSVARKISLGLISLIRLSYLPPLAIPIVGIMMLIFGLISLVYSFGFLITLAPISFRIFLILIAAIIYILNSLLIYKLKNWNRKLIIIASIILITYFIPLLIYLTIFGAWQDFFGGALAFSLMPYIIFPLFLIIFFTRPNIKELFK